MKEKVIMVSELFTLAGIIVINIDYAVSMLFAMK